MSELGHRKSLRAETYIAIFLCLTNRVCSGRSLYTLFERVHDIES